MMKKGWIALLLALPMAMTSCLGGSDPEPNPVAPGIAIYNAARVRNQLASVPADAAVRLAMLLAEADKQGLTDNRLDVEVQVDGKPVKVKQLLFSNDAFIAVNGTKYTLEFRKSDWYWYEGTVEVETGGDGLEDGAEWTITTSGLKAYVNNGLSTVMCDYSDEGETLLYGGNGFYTVELSDIRLSNYDSDLLSGWSGDFRLNAPATSLAYSECHGKEFKMNGLAQDEDLSWEVENVRYKGLENPLNGQINPLILAGDVSCALLGTPDPEVYPSPRVKVVFSNDGKSYTITYNGIAVSQ